MMRGNLKQKRQTFLENGPDIYGPPVVLRGPKSLILPHILLIARLAVFNASLVSCVPCQLSC